MFKLKEIRENFREETEREIYRKKSCPSEKSYYQGFDSNEPMYGEDQAIWGRETVKEALERIVSNCAFTLEDCEEYPYAVYLAHLEYGVEATVEELQYAGLHLNNYLRMKLLRKYFPKVALKEAIEKSKARKRMRQGIENWLMNGGY